jgi:hypothetical protein
MPEESKLRKWAAEAARQAKRTPTRRAAWLALHNIGRGLPTLRNGGRTITRLEGARPGRYFRHEQQLTHDEIRLHWSRDGSGLPLPLGEGRGEGLRSLVKARPLTRFALDDASHRREQIDLSPTGRGVESLTIDDSTKNHPALAHCAVAM